MVIDGRRMMSLFFVIVFGVAVILALGFRQIISLLPLIIGVPGLILSIIVCWKEFSGKEKSHPADLSEKARLEFQMIGWLIGFLLLILLIGLTYSIPLFIFFYTRLQGKHGWLLSILTALICGLVIYLVFTVGFKVQLYRGIFFD